MSTPSIESVERAKTLTGHLSNVSRSSYGEAAGAGGGVSPLKSYILVGPQP